MLLDGPAVVGWKAWRDYDAAACGHHLDEALSGLAGMGLLTGVSVAAAGALLSGAKNEAVLWVATHPVEESQQALDEVWSTLQVLFCAQSQ